jgi:hypothetical protein
LEKGVGWGELRPFGFVKSGFSLGYGGTGPTALKRCLEYLIGGFVPDEVERVILSQDREWEQGTVVFWIGEMTQ